LGPLHCICVQLHTLGESFPEVESALVSLEGWLEVVVPEILAMESLKAEPLGGPMPDSSSSGNCDFDCMAAVRSAMGEMSAEVELSLEDLRDVNEELDLAEMVHMADFHRRRREKAVARGGGAAQANLFDDDDDDDVPVDDDDVPADGDTDGAPVCFSQHFNGMDEEQTAADDAIERPIAPPSEHGDGDEEA